MKRWWIYQKERFPVFANGLLIAAFSACAVSYAALLTGGPAPQVPAFLVAFISCFLFFLQLRIADEFKDKEEDARYRPYRPVPSGLVTFGELRVVFIGAAVIQIVLAWWHAPQLVWILFFAWVYLALMSVEFFARDWLVVRPITYLWTHMLIMPIVDLHATAAYWVPQGLRPELSLFPFLAASFCNGLVIELGRKIRQPDAEEEGVPTYSKLWGRRGAVVTWVCCAVATLAFSFTAAWKIDALWLHGLCMVPVFCLMLFASFGYVFSNRSGKWLETVAGIWTLMLYLSLGLLPLMVHFSA